MVVIVPRIRVVDLRERQPGSWVVFPEDLISTITNMAPKPISEKTVQELYERFSYLQIQMNLGLNRVEVRR